MFKDGCGGGGIHFVFFALFSALMLAAGTDGATGALAGLDRSTPGAGLEVLIGGIERGDVGQVADSIALGRGTGLTEADRRTYAECMIAGSRLRWAVAEKFGEEEARRMAFRGELISVAKLRAADLEWEVIAAGPPLEKAGMVAVALGQGKASKRNLGSMVRGAADGQWRLHRVTEMTALVAIQVDDAPWRNAMVERLLEDLKSGRLTSGKAVGDALVPHAPASRPATRQGDRSTPEGAIGEIEAAIERGEVGAVADGVVRARDAAGSGFAVDIADDAVTARKLRRAIERKFSEEQAKRICESVGLRLDWLEMYRKAAWVVDGDVARAAFEPPERYRLEFRMVKREGAWRISFPPKNQEEEARAAERGEKSREQGMVERTKLRKEVLAHFEEYKMPGALLEALDPARREMKEEGRQVEERIKEMEKEAATHPAPTTAEAKEREVGTSLARLSAALVKKDVAEAAKYYFAEGDEGNAYVAARERRALAAEEFIEAVNKEIGASADRMVQKLGLLNIADDLYGLAMVWGEQAEADGTTKKVREENSEWVPQIRKVGGVWKIDVTAETGGKAKEEARRAEAEAKVLSALTGRIKSGDISTAEGLGKAVREAEIKGNSKRESE